MQKGFVLSWITVIIFSLAGMAQGHGSGQTLTQAVGNYILDLEYESLALRAQEPVRMNFSIRWADPAHKPDLEFTDAWVSIIEANTKGGFDPTVFAAPIFKAKFGPTGMTYVFPAGGIYEVAVRFENGDKTIAESSFELTVAHTPQPMNAMTALLGGLAGLGIGVLGVYMLGKRKNHEPFRGN